MAVNTYSETGSAFRIGVTGPPGAGKSSLTDKLIEEFRNENKIGNELDEIRVKNFKIDNKTAKEINGIKNSLRKYMTKLILMILMYRVLLKYWGI